MKKWDLSSKLSTRKEFFYEVIHKTTLSYVIIQPGRLSSGEAVVDSKIG
jgi:hypothetical protein